MGFGAESREIDRLLHQQLKLEKLTLDVGINRDSIQIMGSRFGDEFNNLRSLKMDDTASESMGFIQFMPNLSMLELDGSIWTPTTTT